MRTFDRLGARAMSKQTKDTIARTALVRFPNGDTQYWLTDREFAVGATVSQNDGHWIVSEITPERDGSICVILRQPETVPDPDEQTDREGWPVAAPDIEPVGPVRDVWPFGVDDAEALA
jgi:hypothetical protein